MKTHQKLRIGPLLVRHFSAVGVIIGVLLAIVGALALWQGQTWQNQYGGWAIIHALYWVVILYLTWLLLTRAPPDFLGMPTVRMFKDGILYVEQSPWLGVGVMTAIYQGDEDGIERLVCAGEVINIQSNGLVQIRVRYDLHGYSSEDDARKALEQAPKDRVLVKPGLFRSAV